MSISGQNLTIVIVTLKSEKVIHNCIKSINKNLPIIVVENSNNIEFKTNLEKTYANVKCILSDNNIGMGPGNNIGIKFVGIEINKPFEFEDNIFDLVSCFMVLHHVDNLDYNICSLYIY